MEIALNRDVVLPGSRLLMDPKSVIRLRRIGSNKVGRILRIIEEKPQP